MRGLADLRRLLLAAAMLGAAVASVEAMESPSFKAYAQGQYMTARKLAETEAAQGSKEAYTLLGEIYEEGLGVAQDYTKAAELAGLGADFVALSPDIWLAENAPAQIAGIGACLRKPRSAA